jgi:branched-chain amino acid transport system ATP-binding protein
MRPRRGQITFDGTRIDGAAVEDLVARGISLVPEGRRIFPGLTVFENLQVASAGRGRRADEFDRDLAYVYTLFPRLAERAAQIGWSLSGGEQQMLAIGRALMSRPRLLLLDEPSLGLAPVLIREVFSTITRINRDGSSILLVEQNAFRALQVAHRGYVLENGHIALAGTAGELAGDNRVKAAYLGG